MSKKIDEIKKLIEIMKEKHFQENSQEPLKTKNVFVDNENITIIKHKDGIEVFLNNRLGVFDENNPKEGNRIFIPFVDGEIDGKVLLGNDGFATFSAGELNGEFKSPDLSIFFKNGKIIGIKMKGPDGKEQKRGFDGK